MMPVGSPDYELGERILTAVGDLVTTDPEVLGGRPEFRGTRMPVEVLFENDADGMSVDEILAGYEAFSRDDILQAVAGTSSV